jgi:tRNA (guanine-N7-)-methyltransferase
MARVRVHQHVNPLSPYYRQSPEPIDVEAVFAEPEKPLLLDIGCARGRFLLKMAEAEPTWNYLGVEIREPLVEEANRLAAEAGLTNLHYAFCNAMLWLDRLLEGIPPGRLKTVTIQFPDPWFKKKHAKRRMVNPEMVETIAKRLAPAGRVFVQTDIEFLAEEMFALFRADGRFEEIPTETNPFPVKTEREKAVEDKDLPVYRAEFVVGAATSSSSLF